MKLLGPAAVLCVALALPACGDNSSVAGELQGVSRKVLLEQLEVSTASGRPEGAKPTKPHIRPPRGFLGKELVLEDLKEGSGPPVRKRDEIVIEYLAVDQNGNEEYSSWNRREPFEVDVGFGYYLKSWEDGLPGMRAGGRRAMIIPPNLTDKLGPLIYVVDVLEIK